MSLKGVVGFVTNPLGSVAGWIFGEKVGRLVRAAGLIAVGVITGNPALIMAGLAAGASALQKKPKTSHATVDRLNANLDPNAPRKIVFGRTALATDIRYAAYTGTDQEYYEAICCVASHEVEAIEEIWFDSQLAWTSAGGAQGTFVGYLTVVTRLVGTAINGIAIDAKWTSACTLTGCAYFHAKFKLTGNSKKAESPFSQSIPSRWTVRGKGAKVPDPRLSTAAGGSGSQSMSDQTTWLYTTAADSGRNAACQILFYLLGYKIGGKLAVGMGCPSTRIDYASFITAANINDESVAKAGGGTEPRYRSDGIFSEDDEPETVLGGLLQSMNAELTDEGGKIGIRVDYDDLATVAVAFTTQDILDGDDWKPSDAAQDVNVVRGRFTDPSDGALYQMADYPQVALTGSDWGSPDGIQRIETFDLPCVQSPSQAQRLAKLRLQRKQYPGMFSARFNMRAWAASYGRIVTLTHASLGFSAKKFRVVGQSLRMDGSVDLALREVNTAQYAWSAEEAAVAAPAVPTAYNPLNSPLVDAIADTYIERGAYSGATTYSLNDVVQDQNVRWVYIHATAASGNAPPTLPTTSNTRWKLWDEKLGSIAPGATADQFFALEAGASSVSLVGNTVTNTGSDGSWDRCVVSKAFAGPVRVRQNIPAGAKYCAVGLDNLATGRDYAVQEIMFFYRTSDGSCQVYRNGAIQTLDSTPASGLTGYIEAVYEKDKYSLYVGGQLVETVTGISTGLTHYAKAWAYNNGVTYDGLVAEPYADLTVIQPVVGKLDPNTGRMLGADGLPTAAILGITNTNDVALSAADVGATATITVPAHERKVPAASGQVTKNYNSGSITGRAFSTKYYIYCDDPSFAGGAVTYLSTTNSDDLTGAAGRVAVGVITTPADGAAGTSGLAGVRGTGAGGGGDIP